ncbi:MAG: acetolactate synthase [Alphaproteobacteria bacterium]|jgi:hypothetical protein|nr:acetolactate synthase [Alphaproteobacteria bacterium]MBU1574621.1 acetolactate synthase [Alphaproteobacteria bacterium]MBU2080106.1 acetolactate synthase [Alphaproteobacteria bacterium]MBU2162881.1 acetolactate synthase [Alphaproteobacteria bacterium]MBU2242894.1 acetolactate synthase [Alphaproteobacteria bacterium]
MILRLSSFAVALSVLALSAAAELTPVDAQDVTVPSGQPVAFYETLMDRPAMGLTARFRFVAPELGLRIKTMPYEALEADLSALCESYALPRLGEPMPSIIVISLSERPTEFGAPDPEVAQVFEAYRPAETDAGAACEWEAF